MSWDTIGGYGDVKRRLQQALEWPLKHAAAFKRLGLQAPRGILLYGPPGEIGACPTALRQAASARPVGDMLVFHKLHEPPSLHSS